jgi:hypothetical protein
VAHAAPKATDGDADFAVGSISRAQSRQRSGGKSSSGENATVHH